MGSFSNNLMIDWSSGHYAQYTDHGEIDSRKPGYSKLNLERNSSSLIFKATIQKSHHV